MKRKLASPCPLQLGEVPDKVDGKWHCGQCNQDVHDISGMGEDQARDFILERASNSRICGEWYEDRSGNVLFAVGRAVAAVAALLSATPAMADGNGEFTGDAIAHTLATATNQALHEAEGNAEGGSALHGDDAETVPTPEPVRPMMRGMMMRNPPPVSSATPAPTTPVASNPPASPVK